MSAATKPAEWDWEELKERGWEPADCLFGCANPIPVKEDGEGIEILPSTRASDDQDCHWSHNLSQPYHVRCLLAQEAKVEDPRMDATRQAQVDRLTAIIIRQEAQIERLEDDNLFWEKDLDETGKPWFSNGEPTETVLRYTEDWVDDHRDGITAGAFETLVLRIRERLAETRR